MSQDRMPRDLHARYWREVTKVMGFGADSILSLIESAYLEGMKCTRDHEALNNEDAARWNALGAFVDERANWQRRVALPARSVTLGEISCEPPRQADVLSAEFFWYDGTLGSLSTVRKFADAEVAKARERAALGIKQGEQQ